MSVTIPYTQKTFTLTTSQASYGSVNERISFSKMIVDYMVETMGIPMTVTGQTAASTSTGATWYQITFTPNLNGLKAMELSISSSSSSSVWTVRAGNEGVFTYAYEPGVYCCNSATKMQLTLRWLKSGNCWFFGFAPHTPSTSYNAWIHCAIVPVRSLSDPDKILTYGLVTQDSNNICKTVLYGNTSQDTAKGSTSRNALRTVLPEVSENYIAMLPLHMDAKDYYFEGVYIGNVVGNATKETAITTNKGTFLVAHRYGESASATYPCLMFDITEAIAAKGV